MNTTKIGREAESAVASYLEQNGHTVLEKNWRTRWCEIDIVSKKKNCVYFTEVKFRSSSAWGDGFSYITAKKMKQMHFAAEFWLANNNWQGESTLAVASVDTDNQIDFVEI